MKAIMVKLECITNMHVGNGDVNYNIIDNEVERDPVTGYPTIHSSGVKGALREYFEGDASLKDCVEDIFGRDSRKKNNGEKKGNQEADSDKDTSPGRVKILSADMLAIPARASKGNEPYYLVSTSAAWKDFSDKCRELCGVELQPTEGTASEGAAEGIDLEKKKYAEYFGKKIYILEESEFKNIALPVMARNKLDNGISENLWYEEVVPHKSIFYFGAYAGDGDKDHLEKFKNGIAGKVIQFGGNASIGYGLCKVEIVAESEA